MAASRAPPTISVQIGTLQEALGTALFRRARRRLELTVPGQLALEPSLRYLRPPHRGSVPALEQPHRPALSCIPGSRPCAAGRQHLNARAAPAVAGWRQWSLSRRPG
ncbi:LysR family transcriptional regulator [Shinella sp.]|uniref:LysR family transcriptional regulator n=1 Tax=Shinella sp. TaxID=1870904 RepID=UPI003F6F2C8F